MCMRFLISRQIHLKYLTQRSVKKGEIAYWQGTMHTIIIIHSTNQIMNREVRREAIQTPANILSLS